MPYPKTTPASHILKLSTPLMRGTACQPSRTDACCIQQHCSIHTLWSRSPLSVLCALCSDLLLETAFVYDVADYMEELGDVSGQVQMVDELGAPVGRAWCIGSDRRFDLVSIEALSSYGLLELLALLLSIELMYRNVAPGLSSS